MPSKTTRRAIVAAVAAAPAALSPAAASTPNDPAFAAALADFRRLWLAFDAALGEYAAAGEPNSGPVADRQAAASDAAQTALWALAATPAHSIAHAAAKLDALLLDGGALPGEGGRVDPDSADGATVEGDLLGLLLADLRRLAAGGAA